MLGIFSTSMTTEFLPPLLGGTHFLQPIDLISQPQSLRVYTASITGIHVPTPYD